MPRNGAGTYSIPNTFTAGQVINSDDVDENYSDIATALTGSVPRNGEAGMDSGAQIKADGGSAAAPGVTFGADPNTGAYSPGADEYGIATGGTKRVGVTDKGVLQSSPVLAIMLPVGAVFDYAGATAPEYSVLCYGQVLSRTTYAELFAAIGTVFNTGGEAGTDFRLPDCRGRVAAGQDDMGGTSANRLTNPASTTGGIEGDSLGATGGSETHELTSTQNGAHTHTAGTLAADSAGAHTHDVTAFNNSGAGNESVFFSETGSSQNTIVSSSNGAHTHTISGSTGSAGSGAAHNNVQPTIILNKCIVTGVAN